MKDYNEILRQIRKDIMAELVAIGKMKFYDGGLLMVSAVDTEDSTVEEFTENTLSLDTLMDIYEYIKYAKLYPENETAK